MPRSPYAAALRKVAALAYPAYFYRKILAGQRGLAPGCILSFDCDFPRDVEVLPELVGLLDRFGVRASFACIGQWVRAYPDEHRGLVEAGHEILNHTENHPNLYHSGYDYARAEGLSREFFNQIGPERRRTEIEQGHQTLTDILGVEVVGYRTPHFGALHVDDVYPVLSDLGYRYSSSLAAGTRGGWPFRAESGIWELPLSPCPRHPFGVFDSWHALAKTGASHRGDGALAGLLADLLDRIGRQGGLANVYFDPCDMLRSGEMERALEVMVAAGVPVLSYSDLVDRLEAEEGVVGTERGHSVH